MTKVCPECGCASFVYTGSVDAHIFCDGDGNALGTHKDKVEKKTTGAVTCTTCTHETTMEQLVTESYFHLVICGGDDEDESE